MKDFHYIYILVSQADEKAHYSGMTRNLKERLLEHNRGICPHTAKHKPWRIETAVAFRSEAKAYRFERYSENRIRARVFPTTFLTLRNSRAVSWGESDGLFSICDLRLPI